MKYRVIWILLGAVLTTNAAGQGNGDGALRVPDWKDAIQVDGVFSPGEWAGAVDVFESDLMRVRMMRHSGDVYLSVSSPGIRLPVVDVFLRPVGMETYQLHASAYLADGVVPDPDFQEVYLGTRQRLDWTANRMEWDASVRDSLAQLGVYGQEFLEQALLPFDGFEFRISPDQFDSSTWFLRIEVASFAGKGMPAVFPPLEHQGDAHTWMVVSIDEEKPFRSPPRIQPLRFKPIPVVERHNIQKTDNLRKGGTP